MTFCLGLLVIGDTPFLAVTTFEQLFDNFSIDTGKLVKLLENLGESVHDHLVFHNWNITHISFLAARQILSLAGGEPKFLQSFLTHARVRTLEIFCVFIFTLIYSHVGHTLM